MTYAFWYLISDGALRCYKVHHKKESCKVTGTFNKGDCHFKRTDGIASRECRRLV